MQYICHDRRGWIRRLSVADGREHSLVPWVLRYLRTHPAYIAIGTLGTKFESWLLSLRYNPSPASL